MDLRIPFEVAIADKRLLKTHWEQLSLPQQVALKCLYGLPLETAEEMKIWSAQQGFADYDALGYVTDVKVVPYVPRKYREAWIIAGRRSGKALDVHTPIPTPTGWRTLNDLHVGDSVFDEQGRACHITFVTETQHHRPCYRLHFSDGSDLVADDDHQWLVWSKASRKAIAEPYRKARPSVKTTAELRANLHAASESNWAIPLAAGVAYPTCTTLPIDPYLFGAWLGDGHTWNARITSADTEIIQAFAAAYDVTQSKDDKLAWFVRGGFRRALRRLCVLGHKYLPDSYLHTDTSQRLALLQGLMDTDGYAGPEECEFYNCNKQIAYAVKELVESLGCRATIRSKIPTLHGKPCKRVWTVVFKAPFHVFRLTRKRNRQKLLSPDKKRFRYITHIEEVPSVPVKCIQVDSPSHLYLAGKSFIPTHNSDAFASTIVAYESTLGGHEAHLRGSQPAYCLQIAQDTRMAQYSLHFIASTLKSSPALKEMIIDEPLANEIRLKNNIIIKCLPPTLKAARGYACPVAVLDEVGVWYQDSDSANPDFEIYNAVKPTQAQFNPNALTVGISSPWTKSGLLYEYYEAGTRGRNAPAHARSKYRNVLVIHAPTAAMGNPQIRKEELEEQQLRDPRAFEREFLAVFQDSISGLIPAQLIKAAVTPGQITRPYRPEFTYVAAIDPAFRHDAFAFTICHAEERGVVMDLIMRFKPEAGQVLNPEDILQQIAPLVRAYNVVTVYSDQYHLESLQQLAFRYGIFIEGVAFRATNKASIYGSLVQLLHQQRMQLVDDEELVRELKALERKLSSTGVVQIGAPQGLHDDLATVTALAAYKCLFYLPDAPKAQDESQKEKSVREVIHEQIQRNRVESQLSGWD